MPRNPMQMMKLMERLKIFQQQHPKAMPFFQQVAGSAMEPGAVIEMKVTDVNGKEYISNIRVTPDDVETVRMLQNLKD